MKKVFGNFYYSIFAVFVFLSVFLFSAWLSNISFFSDLLISPTISLKDKLNLIFSSFNILKESFGLFSAIITVLISFLFAVNITLLIYYVKRKIKFYKSAGLSFFGMIFGLLGVGCAACGSVILSSIFGIGATAGFLGFLPFNGMEFGVLGVVILAFSIFLMAKKINLPEACEPVIK